MKKPKKRKPGRKALPPPQVFDCGEDECGKCRVCLHYEFEEWINSVGKPDCAWSVTWDDEVIAYIKAKSAKAA